MDFRLFKPKDLDQVVNLLNFCFPTNKITAQTFWWKHFDDFFQGQTIAFVAYDQDQIVGFVCFTPFEIVVNSKIEMVWLCAVQACHPKFRRLGIVKELTLGCEAIIGKDKTYIGFSNASGIKIDQNSKSINYQIIGQMQETIILPSLQANSNYQLNQTTELTKINFEPNSLVKNQSKFTQFNRSTKFVNWRYVNNPKVKYQFWQVVSANQILATVIVNKTSRFVQINEIIFLEGNLQSEIFGLIANHFFFTEFKFTKFSYLLNDYWTKLLSKRLSFSKSLQTYVTIKSNNLNLAKANNWHITNGQIL